MTATKSSKLLFTVEREKQVSAIVANGYTATTIEIPALWDIYSDSPAPVIQERLEGPEDRVAIFIHTSGTTGKCLIYIISG